MFLIKRAFLFASFAVFIISCSSMPAQQKIDGAEVVSKTIEPKAVIEDCMQAVPGQKIVYNYDASMPVNFNIHYHDEGQVTYGTTALGESQMDTSTYEVPVKQYYCLMWTNTNSVEVQLTYSCKVAE